MGEDSARLVTVTCSKHHEHLVKGLWNFVENERGLDYDLPCGGAFKIRAHRLIAEVFLSPLKPESESSAEPGTGNEHRNTDLGTLMLEFLYKGTVTVPRDRLDELLQLARSANFGMMADAVVEAGNDGQQPKERRGRVLRQRKGVSVKRANSDTEKKPEDDEWLPSIKKKTPKSKKQRHARSGEGGPMLMRPIKTETTGSVAETSLGKRKPAGDKRVKRLAAVTETAVYRCGLCDFKTQRKISYEVHRAEHDPSVEIFPCAQCGQKFPSLTSLGRHESRHTGVPYTYSCQHCPSTFRSKWAYDVHQSKHDSSIEVFRCDLCSHVFLNFRSLERHKLGHATYTCARCDYVTRKRWQYDDHLFSAHGVNARGEAMARLACQQCDYTCKTKQQLANHAIAHHSGVKPFKCELCPFASGRKTDLVSHVNVNHKGIKKELCDLCGYRTVSKSKLLQHKLTHSKEKPFKCELCGACYADRSSHKRHVQKHLNPQNKPYLCHLCSHACNRNSNLKTHLRNVHKYVQSESDSRRNANNADLVGS